MSATQTADGWDLADKSTWITSFDPSDREQVRRAWLQAGNLVSEARTDEEYRAAVRAANRVKRYWDKVK